MAGEIKSLEIFGAGTWTPGNSKVPVVVTETDLDHIAEAFTALQGTNIVKPHLKLGHDDAQKWFGQRNGIPTLGWIDRVWRQGSKLMADISNVPDALISMIKERRYHNVSAEVYPPGVIEHGGRTFGHVLSAVAVLGTEMPAVQDLAGLASALFANQFSAAEAVGATVAFTPSQGREPAMFTQEQVDALISAAVAKAVTEKATEFSGKVADAKTELAAAVSRAEVAEAKLTTLSHDFAKREAEALVNAAIHSGKLLPRQKDMALAFMSTPNLMVKFGGAEKSAAELFGEFINSFGAQVDLKEKGSGKHGQDKPGEFATAAQELAAAIEEVRAGDPKLEYMAARNAVFAKDPDLKGRYAAGE
jgi:hypothetical protein